MRIFGLDDQGLNSLLAAVLVLALIIVPQFLFTVPSAERAQQLEAAIARRRAIGQNGAKKFRELMEKSARAFGHTPREKAHHSSE